ncbi:hypothetical protein M2103_002048 [Ereboglobus sp. PH5-5]|uniref:OadG family transporter subunit n=1 Tax=unclassified Ereboglobus TaxID=2626932 RepID=UPI00240525E6|nr:MULTISPECIES: OadG family transporter subunit [unclassified Ereboglobus]MDF9826227.1 hypothetical protein [Ereboglobus sp. PH5-10]MDF9833815.1 hypothetical protein [Ereboglobus sp. PH5-5]
MTNTLILLAQTAAPEDAVLFGNKWIALAVILSGVAIFIALIALFGRILAATHPDEKKTAGAKAKSAAPAPLVVEVPNASTDTPSPQILAVIAAAVATVFGPRARIAGVQTAKPPTVEALMQMWSLEGRRQIYTSHNPRG